MNPDTLRLVLQIVGVVVGGGILEFIRRLLARRAELRNLNAQSDATALDSANAYVKTLQESETGLRTEIQRMQKEWNAERVMSTEALANATRELERLQAELARRNADLAVAHAQISELGGRLPGRHRDPLSPDYDWRRGP